MSLYSRLESNREEKKYQGWSERAWDAHFAEDLARRSTIGENPFPDSNPPAQIERLHESGLGNRSFAKTLHEL